MKTSNKILLGGLAFIVISLLSLMIAARVSLVPVEKIQGNGQMKTKTRDVGSFNKIEVKTTSFDIYLSQGDPRVEVTSDENLAPYIKTYVEDGILKIDEEDGKRIESFNRLAVTISTNQLDHLAINSPGNVYTQDTFNLKSTSLEVNGVADINFAINAEMLIAAVNGPGSINLTGKTAKLEVYLTGVGDLKASDFKTNSANVSVNGPGDAYINVSESLNVDITGVGSVGYKGNPQLHSNINGPGKVYKIED